VNWSIQNNLEHCTNTCAPGDRVRMNIRLSQALGMLCQCSRHVWLLVIVSTAPAPATLAEGPEGCGSDGEASCNTDANQRTFDDLVFADS